MVMMDKPKITDISAYTDRRLHPVRLAIGHLNRLLVANKGTSTMTVDRALLDSVTTTLEIFVEDFEINCKGAEDRKAASTVDAPRVAQTRVG